MKSANIETDRAEITIVELPENARDLKIFNDSYRPYLSYWQSAETLRYYFPDGYKCLAFIPDLTEEMVEPLVNNYLANMDTPPVYEKYNVKREDFEEDGWAHCANDALESFISLLETKIYFNNPFTGMKKKMVFTDYTGHEHEEINPHYRHFIDAQSRTFDKARTLVLVKN